MDDAQTMFQSAFRARRSLNSLDEATINAVLEDVAKETEYRTHYILSENEKDLQLCEKDNPLYDRLMLTEERIKGIVADIRNVIKLSSPVDKFIETHNHPNGMTIRKKTVPFGVIGIIYEARPNVSFDVFSLCFKTKNVCLLKGGSDAKFSNRAIVDVIRGVLDNHGLNPNICSLLPNDRETTSELLKATQYVDLIIPRGGQALIKFVRENSLVSVIETGAGVCHTYFDKAGDIEKAKKIIYNAKTRRVTVCNTLDCLVLHKERLQDLPALCERLKEKDVVIYADKQAYETLSGLYPEKLLEVADDISFGTEFLSYKMAVKTVSNIDEALDHIEQFGSKHSESIISEDKSAIAKFENEVDASCVYANVSTAFTDGAQFGFGAEIGISTQKMHARGPMALPELCSYKWIVDGDGQIRES